MKEKTYVDSGVLLTAVRGLEQDAEDAFRLLDDPDRESVSNIYVKLELLPKAVCNKNREEIQFYEAFFEAGWEWAPTRDELTWNALKEAIKWGIAVLDALHVAAAASSVRRSL
jgi:hypothetical protein